MLVLNHETHMSLMKLLQISRGSPCWCAANRLVLAQSGCWRSCDHNKCCWSEVWLWATWTKVYSGQATHISSAEVAACKQTSVDCCITAKFIPIIGFTTPLQKNWTCQHPNKHTLSHTAVKVPINPSPPSPPSQSWLPIPPCLPAPSASCSQFHWDSHSCRLLPLKLMIPSKRRLDLKKINIHTSCALFVSTCSKLFSEAT